MSKTGRIVLGLLPMGFFAVHAACQLRAGRPENLLWACHVADLCVGCGLIFRRPTLLTAGVLMLMVGLPLWLINLAYGGAFYPTSVLTHVGGLVMGLLGLRVLGVPQQSWHAALVVVGGLILLSRAFTPLEANVNLAYTPWHWLSPWLQTMERHILFLLAFWIVTLSSCEWLLRRSYWGDSPARLYRFALGFSPADFYTRANARTRRQDL